MDTKDLLIPLLAALWACSNLVFSATIELNRIRNAVVTGEEKGVRVPGELQKHMMSNDWLPLAICLTLTCFGFSAVAGFSPVLLKSEACSWGARLITLGVAGYTGVMGILWIPAARADWQLMKSALEGRRAEPRGVALPPAQV